MADFSDKHVRKIPTNLYAQAKAFAALDGMTLSEFIIAAIEQAVTKRGKETSRRGRGASALAVEPL